MHSILISAWAQVLKRARADWLILSAAALTIVLATTLLSAGPIYAAAVSVGGLRLTLHKAAPQKADVQIYSDVAAADYAVRDARVAQAASRAFAPIGAVLERSGRSTSYALPGQTAATATNLMVFAFFRGVQGHARLTAGAWPSPAAGGHAGQPGQPIEAAIPVATAQRLHLQPGSELAVVSRIDPSRSVQVRISGLYQVDNASDPYWWGDLLDTTGIDSGASFTTYGPFVLDPAEFFAAPSADGGHFTWRVYPNFARTEVSTLPALITGIDGLEASLNQGLADNARLYVETGLGTILRDSQRSLLVTQAGILVVTLELAILAGYALLLSAGLLVDQRSIHTGLLHSRGASTAQVLAMAVMEAALLALPAALAGPWLATLSLTLLNRAGPLSAIDLAIHPEVSANAYALAFASAVVCVVALALPSRQSARSFVQARTARGRQLLRGFAQRARLDLVLVAAAGLGLWQLRLYGAPLTQSVQGSLGIDPLLIAAPAIGLLAGALLALRGIPLLARLIDLAAPRIRPLVPALGAWQLARRPMVYARSALLLMLAVAIGIFSLSYSSTWARSQQDQSSYQVGADVRLLPDIRPTSSIPEVDLAQAHQQLAGVEETMPVLREYLTASEAAAGWLLALDSAHATSVVSLRPDLSDRSFGRLMGQLTAARPDLSTIRLPGKPERLAIDARLVLDPVPAGVGPNGLPAAFFAGPGLAPTIKVTLRDGRGLLHQLDPLDVPADGTVHRLVWPLAFRMSSGALAVPSYPLAIVAAEVDVNPRFDVSRSGEIDLDQIGVSEALDGQDWVADQVPPSGVIWTPVQYGLTAGARIAPASSQPPNGLAARFSIPRASGFTSTQLSFNLTAAAAPLPDQLPALASQQFLDATSTRVGSTLPVELEGARREVHIIGALQGFPTLAPERANLVVDLPTLQALRFESDGRVASTSEWWLTTDPSRRASVLAALRSPPYSSPEVDDRETQTQALRGDPEALGTIGALSLGYVAAALFAALGFLVNAVVSSWARLREFALLRAVGLSPGQLSGWLALENAILVVISLVGGTALGLVMAWLILPVISLTQGGTPTVPTSTVVVPWLSVSLLEGCSLAVLLLAIGGLALAIRRISLGQVLRLGEE